MPLRVTKALLAAAGPAQRRLPLQTPTDRDGAQKPALAIIPDKLLAAGIEQVGLVQAQGDRAACEAVLAPSTPPMGYIGQPSPLGYGHAVLCGREFVGNQPFPLQACDHLYISQTARRCTRQLLDIAEAENCAVSAVQPTHEGQLQYYGTVGGTLVAGHRGLTAIERVLEKPTPTLAEQHCLVPGLRAGSYLCFFGMHVLPPAMAPSSHAFLINPRGTYAQLLTGDRALFSPEYYLYRVPGWVRHDQGAFFVIRARPDVHFYVRTSRSVDRSGPLCADRIIRSIVSVQLRREDGWARSW